MRILSFLFVLISLPIHSQNRQELAKSDSLFAAGVELYNKGIFNEAIPIFYESDRIDKTELDSTSNRRDYSAMWLASCYFNLGDTIKAKEIHQYYKFIPVDRRLTIVSDSLSAMGMKYVDRGLYEDALSCFIQCAEIEKDVVGDKHIWYANSINICRLVSSSLKQYEDALKYGTEYLQLYQLMYGKDNLDYASLLSDLAGYNYNINNYVEAMRLCMEALCIREKVLGKEHPDYATSLNNLAVYNSSMGNYSEAIRLCTEALGIFEKFYGKEHTDYATSLNNLAQYNSSLGNYSEAIRLCTEVLSIREKVLGKEHPDYATSLNDLAMYNSSLGNYSEAIRLCTEAFSIREKVLGKEHSDYATSLNDLADYNNNLGNYAEAIRLCTEALGIREILFGKEHLDYARSLSSLALFNSNLGNYAEAMRLETEVLGIREKLYGKVNPNDYAMSLNNLAGYNFQLCKYKEAVSLCEKASDIWKEIYGKNHPNYALSLFNLAVYYSCLNDYAKAISFVTEASNIWKNVLGREHRYYASSLTMLASLNSKLGNNSEAIRLSTEALGIFEKIFGKEHPEYVASLKMLVLSYWRQGNIETTKTLIDATKLISNIITKTFSDLTTKERSLFWNKYKQWFERNVHLVALDMPSDSLYENGYNGVLLCKGLLLNSEVELRKLLQESGDKEIENLYDDLRILRLQIDRQMEKSVAERFLNVDSLKNVAQNMERILMQRSKVYGDYTKNLSINWKQVQQKLGDKDIAIEFVSFPTTGDSVMYTAYCLRKGMNVPKMYPLFEAKQLKAVALDAYSKTDVGRLVWKPLQDEMKDVDNVYFSPGGELYNIAIESIPDWEEPSRLVSDRWNLYRLSSTRELALIKDKNDIKKSAVYGGLKYNTDETMLVNDSKKYSATRDFDFFSQNVADSLNLRSGVQELPQTKVEALNIDKKLSQIKIANNLYTDTIGTEASFKALSGQKRNLLHIATHGFYWTESDVQKMNNPGFIMTNDDNPRYTEDKAMTRSGLLLAGANNALMGKHLPENVDDGILTAKEISTLDLRGLDLVVLSACQTGLGEITGDGVFGLQRGFKKAGANTLVMSLWKVDDNATQMFMTQFYANLISGKSKFDALREAQRYVREYEEEKEIKENDGTHPVSAHAREQAQNQKKVIKKIRPYKNPKYWAAFILLDGID